ncbi:hypothetical protein [Paraburkholderia sp.]|uniref:hypothetical protein n=1 Tax=Paraburkholderia sp. TaxID=1926495 RepID=UPI00238D648C|nr:hypothetical protein [Paraburkholderia sp.]MDE1181852.1 hypothetical protein [Paraburkholderia sp.]
MNEVGMGLTIAGIAVGIAFPLMITHYRRERQRARLMQRLDHFTGWYGKRRKS